MEHFDAKNYSIIYYTRDLKFMTINDIEWTIQDIIGIKNFLMECSVDAVIEFNPS